MLMVERYPIVITCDGIRRRPGRVMPLEDDSWRVDWIDGGVTLYRCDPRAHLRLGYDPRHLRRDRSPLNPAPLEASILVRASRFFRREVKGSALSLPPHAEL
jgi:hypothetical protein